MLAVRSWHKNNNALAMALGTWEHYSLEVWHKVYVRISQRNSSMSFSFLEERKWGGPIQKHKFTSSQESMSASGEVGTGTFVPITIKLEPNCMKSFLTIAFFEPRLLRTLAMKTNGTGPSSLRTMEPNRGGLNARPPWKWQLPSEKPRV